MEYTIDLDFHHALEGPFAPFFAPVPPKMFPLFQGLDSFVSIPAPGPFIVHLTPRDPI